MNAFFCLPMNKLVAAAVLGLMAITSEARADSKSADLHYLAVGVSKVPMMGPQSELRYAHKDAEDLAKTWLAQKGGIYQNVRGETLTNEKAKLADILAALDRLEVNAKAGDTAVVSFAGHGGVVGRRNTQWVFTPNDFNPYNPPSTALYEWKLREYLTRMTQRGVTVILVLDTCHAGAFAAADSGVVVFAACTAFQESFENDQFKNGLFTFALIEALQGKADANRDGMVTLAEIDAYLTMRLVQMHALNPAFDQHGLRIVQSPLCHGAAGMQRDLPVAGGGTAIPQPSPAQDRFRIPTVR